MQFGEEIHRPLAIDLFCGLGGWTEGLLAEGYDVIGFDIERHDYGTGGYPAQLVLQDAMTLHGKQFKDVDLIVASPPCQEYSYMAMPWSRAKAIEEEYKSGVRDVKQLTALFDACFRIQREACEAAGRHIPMVVENVRGANKWVGRSRWNYGSFHLWGDVPALMPMNGKRKLSGRSLDINRAPGGIWGVNNLSPSGDEYAEVTAGSKNRGARDEGQKTPYGNCSEVMWKDRPIVRYAHPTTDEMEAHGFKVPGFLFDGSGKSFQTASVEGIKTVGHANKRDGHSHTRHLTNQAESDGIKNSRNWWSDGPGNLSATTGSKSSARKAASAHIAKIPLPLSRHIARYWKPQGGANAIR